MIEVIPQALLPIFFVLILGYSAGRFRVINNVHVDQLNTLLMNYSLPAALFVATGSTSREAMVAQWPLFVIVGGAMMSVYACWYLARILIAGPANGVTALQALTISLPNAAALGLPVTSALMGPGHAAPVAVVITMGSLLPAPLTLAILEISAAPNSTNVRSEARIAHALLHTLYKPIVLAPIAGMVLSLLAWPLPRLIVDSLQPIAAAAGGLALFITGLILSVQRFGLSWNSAAATIAANIVRPIIAFGIASMLPIPVQTEKLAVLFASFPSGFYGILFGSSYGLKTNDVGSTVIASTASASVTVALTMAWLYG